MENGANRTLVCSVLFLDIVQYSTMPVSDQLEVKESFNAALASALEQIAPRDRVILDTGDGAAVTFMGDPEDALFAAIAMRDLIGAVPVRLGVNLGPVRLVKDLNGRMNIIGDGINVAQRVMSFARPGQLLVSRSFYEVVSCLSGDYQKLFHREGSRKDKHVREHEVYSVLAKAGEDAHSEPPPLQASTSAARRPMLGALAATLAVVSIAALIVQFQSGAFSPVIAAPEASPSATVPAGGRGAAKTRASSADQARIEVLVSPWGEVVVDGRSRGMSPQVLSLAPGPHTVEIRNSSYPIHVERLDVRAGQALRISHTFY